MDHYQYVVAGLALLTFIFGGGLFWKIQEERRRRRKEAEIGDGVLRVSGGRFIRKMPVAAGKFVEIQSSHYVFRISVEDIVERHTVGRRSEKIRAGAVISVNSGGMVFYCGREVIEEATNRFFVPLMEFSESEPFSVYKLFEHRGRIFSFQIFVDHIDMFEKSAHLSVAIGYYL